MSLEGLPAAHLRVLLDGLPVFERYGLLLAGGYAFRAHEILHRPSQDLDFATRNDTPLPEIAGHVRNAFQSAGYDVELVEATGRYARLTLRLPGSGEALEMDMLKEALDPSFVTVQVSAMASVRALSLEDTVGLKARAWHDRFVIRDIIDLHAAAGAFSYIDLERLARRHEPDLDLETILDHLAGVGIFPDEDFVVYELDEAEITDLRSWVTGWYDDLARRLAAELADEFPATYDCTRRMVAANERPAVDLTGRIALLGTRDGKAIVARPARSQMSCLLDREASTRSRNPSTASHSSFSG